MAIFKNRKKYAVSTQEQEVKIKLTKMAKREMVLTMISIFAVLIVSMGSAYAVFTSFDSSKEYNQVSVGKLDITYQAEEGEGYSNKINLEGAFPEPDGTGMESVPYKFTLTNNGTLAASYTVSIKDDQELISQDGCGEKQLDKNQIKISINGGSPEILSSLLDVTGENYVIDQGDLSKGASRSYEVRMWIDNDAGNEVLGTHFHGMIVVDGKEFRSGDGSPILSDNLIPVVYDGSNWVTTKEEDPEWYNYEERKWANAITVREGVRESYKKSGKTVDVVNDVLQMWVWIPRYSYTIKDTYGKGGDSTANPGEIDVKFIDTAQKDGGEATYSGESPENWYTPPGFTFGGKELPGLWVGKFETGYSSGDGAATGVGTAAEAQVDEPSTNRAIIKPNVHSWRGIRVSTLDTLTRQMIKAGNVFGFDLITYDSHVAKNSEWALISYLTQSKYGKYGDDRYQDKEVYINNNSDYVTGCSSGLPSADGVAACQNTYNVDQAGTGASSTGNIYGIYDLNGGSWEYTMGVLTSDGKKYSGNTEDRNSGYTGLLTDGSTFQGKNWPASKYYDVYTSNDTQTACNGNPCKGHALNEVAGWYGDFINMVNTISAYSMRSGRYAVAATAGIFAFGCDVANNNGSFSFRQVLTPQ